MKNAFRLTCLAIGLCFTALPAQAIDFKPYAGAGAGTFVIDAGLGSDNVFGYYGVLGADLHEYYGFELRIGNIGDTVGSQAQIYVPPDGGDFPPFLVTTPVEAGIDYFIAYLFKAQYPVVENLRIYGVIGATTMKATLTFAGGTASDVSTTFSFGGGVDYRVAPQWLVALDGTVYANSADTDNPAKFDGLDVWGFTGMVKYEF